MPIEVPAGGAAFHDGWSFHGSPAERARRRRAALDHQPHGLAPTRRWNPTSRHPIYSRYRRPGELELDEAFFPIMWREDGHRTPYIESHFAAAA